MAQVSSSEESLMQAMQSRIIPNQEYLLQGSILDSAVDLLMQRLRGLCDNADTPPETFHDLEACMSVRIPNQPQPMSLRVRRALDCDVPYQVRYIGQPELDRARPTVVRSSIDVAVTPSIVEFLHEIGYRTDFEYISRGFMFLKGRMKVLISKIIKIVHGKNGEVLHEPLSQSYLVELSVLAPSGQEAIGVEMRNFADQLKPLVQLEKMDYNRLETLSEP